MSLGCHVGADRGCTRTSCAPMRPGRERSGRLFDFRVAVGRGCSLLHPRIKSASGLSAVQLRAHVKIRFGPSVSFWSNVRLTAT